MIVLTCSNCSKVLRLKPKYAGRKFKCPKCAAVLKAPKTAPAAPQQRSDNNDDFTMRYDNLLSALADWEVRAPEMEDVA